MTTADQRLAALDAANQIRIDRAILRSRIKAGEVSATQVLAEWPECIHGAAAFAFLTYLPNIGARRRDNTGSSRAFVLLRKCNAPGHKRLDQLTPGQLERLTRVVRDYEQAKHPAERGLA